MFVVQPQRASSFVSADWVFSKWTLRAGSSSFANKLPTLIKSQLNRLCGRTVFFWEKRTEDRFFQQSVTRWIDPISIGCLAKLRRKFGASGRLGLEWFTTAHFLYQIIQINGIIIYLYYIIYPYIYIYMCFIHMYIYIYIYIIFQDFMWQNSLTRTIDIWVWPIWLWCVSAGHQGLMLLAALFLIRNACCIILEDRPINASATTKPPSLRPGSWCLIFFCTQRWLSSYSELFTTL